jgi:sortase A
MIVRARVSPGWALAVRYTSWTLVVSGLAALVQVGWTEVERRLYQRSQLEKAAPVGASPSAPTRALDGSRGIIEIPRLGLRAAIHEGVDAATLRRAVGHLPHSALPGEAGNLVVAAHRDTFFRPLRQIRQGDVLRFVDGDLSSEYVVDSIRIVKPTAIEVLRPTSTARATLVTCYPFDFIGPAPQRFIVGASLARPTVD